MLSCFWGCEVSFSSPPPSLVKCVAESEIFMTTDSPWRYFWVRRVYVPSISGTPRASRTRSTRPETQSLWGPTGKSLSGIGNSSCDILRGLVMSLDAQVSLSWSNEESMEKKVDRKFGKNSASSLIWIHFISTSTHWLSKRPFLTWVTLEIHMYLRTWGFVGCFVELETSKNPKSTFLSRKINFK